MPYKTIQQLSRQSIKRRYGLSTLRDKRLRRSVNSESKNGAQHVISSPQHEQIAVIADVNEMINVQDDVYFNTSEEDENYDDDMKLKTNIDVMSFLRTWSNQFKIGQNALSILLKFLKNNGFEYLPSDARTLLKTPKQRNAVGCFPGRYVHLGISTAIEKYLLSVTTIPDEILLDFNIDGLPISKSSQSSFWLILTKIVNSDQQHIFVTGIYHGYNKPADFNQFLRPFVDELKDLNNEGLNFNDRKVAVATRAFICDAPAKSSCVGTKSHSAYHGCQKCTEEGDFVKNRMTFQINNSLPRTDNSFRNRNDPDHHNHTSILEELPIDMVKSFPLDYLHLVCLGVVKKLLHMWVNGEPSSLVPTRSIREISLKLENISHSQPKEIQRKIRPLKELHHFKGSEFRVFLLYSGPFVLKNILNEERYNHFLQLHVAIRILCDPKLCQKKSHVAQNILTEFVKNFGSIYGRHHLTYNVHNLVHLSEDVTRFGCLDSFSAFPFESYMYTVKKMLRKTNQPLEQLYNRVMEMNYITNTIKTKENIIHPVLKNKTFNNEKPVYNKVIFPTFQLDNDCKNKWFLTTDKNIMEFRHAEFENNIIKIQCFMLAGQTDFYTRPLCSSKLNIFQARKDGKVEKTICISLVDKKLFCMENQSFYVLFALQH